VSGEHGIFQWRCYWVFQLCERAIARRILVLVLPFVIVLVFVLGLVIAVLLLLQLLFFFFSSWAEKWETRNQPCPHP
jgi:uncharacterized membrane protein